MNQARLRKHITKATRQRQRRIIRTVDYELRLHMKLAGESFMERVITLCDPHRPSFVDRQIQRLEYDRWLKKNKIVYLPGGIKAMYIPFEPFQEKR
jgi:hypothetical protein